MPTKTKMPKTKAEVEAAESFHLDPNSCPGRKFFEEKEKRDEEVFRNVLNEVLGPLPKRMKQASDNRIWLWFLTPLVIANTAMSVVTIVMLLELAKTIGG